jgi:hypothetical protein
MTMPPARRLLPPALAALLAACATGEGGAGDAAAGFADGLTRLKGGSVGAAYAALGRPDSARPLRGGGYVIAWNRDAPAPAGGVSGSRECVLLGAVTRRGVVSDFTTLGDPLLCAESFKKLP